MNNTFCFVLGTMSLSELLCFNAFPTPQPPKHLALRGAQLAFEQLVFPCGRSVLSSLNLLGSGYSILKLYNPSVTPNLAVLIDLAIFISLVKPSMFTA